MKAKSKTMMRSAMPYETDHALVAALDTFVDLMAQRPVPPGMRSFSLDDIHIIEAYAKKFGLSHVGLSRRIFARRDALKQEALSFRNEAADLVAADDGAVSPGNQSSGVDMPLLTISVSGVTLDVGNEINIRFKDGVTLRVDGNQPRDELFEHHDAAGQHFDFKPQFKIVVGRHVGVSSVELWRAYQDHCRALWQGEAAE